VWKIAAVKKHQPASSTQSAAPAYDANLRLLKLDLTSDIASYPTKYAILHGSEVKNSLTAHTKGSAIGSSLKRHGQHELRTIDVSAMADRRLRLFGKCGDDPHSQSSALA
jgi:hypothetical protein